MASSIVIVRHGETDWSAQGKHTGRTDIPLNEQGRAKAIALGEQLQRRAFAAVLCSPLRRAQETCELAGFGEQASVCEELREWDYGDYEGLTTPQIRERRPDWNLWRDGCPGGESPDEVGARADAVLARVRPTRGDALLFAHGHILRVLTARWIGYGADAGAHFALRAAGVGVLDHERETPVVEEWNVSRIG